MADSRDKNITYSIMPHQQLGNIGLYSENVKGQDPGEVMGYIHELFSLNHVLMNDVSYDGKDGIKIIKKCANLKKRIFKIPHNYIRLNAGGFEYELVCKNGWLKGAFKCADSRPIRSLIKILYERGV